jgi:hypothetical protein
MLLRGVRRLIKNLTNLLLSKFRLKLSRRHSLPKKKRSKERLPDSGKPISPRLIGSNEEKKINMKD